MSKNRCRCSKCAVMLCRLNDDPMPFDRFRIMQLVMTLFARLRIPRAEKEGPKR